MARLPILLVAGLVLGAGFSIPGVAQEPPPKKKLTRDEEVREALRLIGELEKKLVEQNEERAKAIRLIERDIRILRATLPGGEREAKPARSVQRQKTRELARMLAQTIDIKDLQEKVKLTTALRHFADHFGGKLVILVDKEAFATDLGADAPDPYEEEVSLPAGPSKMQMEKALRLVMAQVGQGHGTYIIRPDFVEITTRKYASAAFAIRQATVFSEFSERPLAVVLEDLSDETSVDIHLDPAVGKKADAVISAAFRNGTLESALVTVTEIAGLKYVVWERSIFVTTPERAKILQKEEDERSKQREIIDKMLRPRRLEAAS